MIEVKNGLVGKDRVIVAFDGATVTIRRGTLGKNEARIPVSRITMVGFRKRLGGNGEIEFAAAGVDGRVHFTWRHAKDFEALRAAVDEKVSA